MHPDIAFAISNVACFAHRPTASHCSALKKIVAYLKGTKEFGISFQPSSNPNFLTAYCNADYAMDLENHKSRSGALFMLKSGPVAWLSRKKPCTASSIIEAKYLAAHVPPRSYFGSANYSTSLATRNLTLRFYFQIISRLFVLSATLSNIRKLSISTFFFMSSRSIRPTAPSTSPTFLRINNSLIFSQKLSPRSLLFCEQLLEFINLHSSRDEWEMM
jgi:hypothetical protein